MPQQVLHPPQLIMKFTARGELHAIAFGRERRHGLRSDLHAYHFTRDLRCWLGDTDRSGFICLHSPTRARGISQRRFVRYDRALLGQLAHARGNIWQRMARADQPFDFRLGSMAGGLEKLSSVGLGQTWLEQRDRAQIQRRRLQIHENLGKQAHCPRSTQAQKTSVLGELQDLRAVSEHRRATLGMEDPTPFDFGQVRDQSRCRRALALSQALDRVEQGSSRGHSTRLKYEYFAVPRVPFERAR
jgi:hypothetical protein